MPLLHQITRTDAVGKQFTEGDRVTPDTRNPRVPWQTRGREFTVTKINPKNVKCTSRDGGRGINFPPELLVLLVGRETAADKARELGAAKPIVREVPLVPHFDLGAVVVYTGNDKRRLGIQDNEPFIVLSAPSPRGRIRIARLGGDGNQYFNVSASSLAERTDYTFYFSPEED